MNQFEAIILGAVQGATEFLPISSSGHLKLGATLLGIQEPTLLFDITLHVGSLIAVCLVYGITLAVHWVLFVIAFVVLGLYFRKAHLVLRRSFAMMRGRHIWVVLAVKSELEAQRLCRKLDPKSIFVPDLVGPPVVDEPPKKKRRRRASN